MDSSGSNWTKYLIVLGIILVIGAVAYAVVHKGQPTNSNPNACVNKTFSVGASGACISDGQNLLNWYLYGIDQPNYMKVTGTFSSSMQAAVQKAQSGASLGVNGQLNKQTWNLLCESDDPPNWWKAAAKSAGCPDAV